MAIREPTYINDGVTEVGTHTVSSSPPSLSLALKRAGVNSRFFPKHIAYKPS